MKGGKVYDCNVSTLQTNIIIELKTAITINGNKVYTEIQGLDTRLTEADKIYTEFANTNQSANIS